MNNPNLDARTEILVKNLRQVVTDVFGGNLVGVYIHGSLALGSYNPHVSDLDYVIVVSRAPSKSTKLRLMRATFDKLIPYAPQKGLEFHVLTQNELKRGRHPFYFELHYSPMHKREYIDDPEGYVAVMHGLDPDLAVHLAVIWQSGIVVTGRPIRSVFSEISSVDYFDSALRDVSDAATEIMGNPVYTILNLCRLVGYMSDGIILSKADGGCWAIGHTDSMYNPIIKWALAEYTGSSGENREPHKEALTSFAQAMLARIAALQRRKED